MMEYGVKSSSKLIGCTGGSSYRETQTYPAMHADIKTETKRDTQKGRRRQEQAESQNTDTYNVHTPCVIITGTPNFQGQM